MNPIAHTSGGYEIASMSESSRSGDMYNNVPTWALALVMAGDMEEDVCTHAIPPTNCCIIDFV